MTLDVEELVDIVADDWTGETIIETVPRSQANGKLYWTSQVIPVNSAGEVLVTLRAKQEGRKYSEWWEIGITETRRTRESKEEAARWGLEEELLIPIEEQGELQPLFDKFYRHPLDKKDRKNVAVFSCIYDGEIRYDRKEIARVELLLPKQINKQIDEMLRRYTPMNITVWDAYKDILVLHER